MKGFERFLIRLYPAKWRARYGEEFEALLDDSSSGFPAVLDLLKGAIKMHFSVPTFPKLALILSVTGLLAGLLVSALVTPTYKSGAEVRLGIGADSTSRPDFVEYLTRFEQEVFSRASLSAIIQAPRLNLYPDERAKEPLEDVIERMRKKDIQIRIETPAGTGQGSFAVSVAFYYRDRVKARDTVQSLLTRFVEANFNHQLAQSTAGQGDQFRRLDARLAAVEKRLGIEPTPPEPGDQFAVGYGGMNLRVVDPPSLPIRAVFPNPWLFMAAGFGVGFVAALVIAIFRRRPPAIPFPAQTT